MSTGTRVPLGQVVMTPGVEQLLYDGTMTVEGLLGRLRRHEEGDWGALSEEDRRANDAALAAGDRLVSAYPVGDAPRPQLWIITEADRSVTTALLPEEY